MKRAWTAASQHREERKWIAGYLRLACEPDATLRERIRKLRDELDAAVKKGRWR